MRLLKITFVLIFFNFNCFLNYNAESKQCKNGTNSTYSIEELKTLCILGVQNYIAPIDSATSEEGAMTIVFCNQYKEQKAYCKELEKEEVVKFFVWVL